MRKPLKPLAEIEVKGRAPRTGYDRDLFGDRSIVLGDPWFRPEFDGDGDGIRGEN